MRLKPVTLPTVLVLAIGLQACNSQPGCILLPQEGLKLTVEDAGDGRSLNSLASVTVLRVSPLPRESRTGSIAPENSGNPLLLTHNRPGTYDVTISVPGYNDRSERVSVEQNESFCKELKSVELIIRLERRA